MCGRTAKLVEDSPEKVLEAEEVEDKAAVVVTIVLLMCLGERHSQVVGALRWSPYRSDVDTSFVVPISQQLPQWLHSSYFDGGTQEIVNCYRFDVSVIGISDW
jgi:hypothetical protein